MYWLLDKSPVTRMTTLKAFNWLNRQSWKDDQALPDLLESLQQFDEVWTVFLAAAATALDGQVVDTTLNAAMSRSTSRMVHMLALGKTLTFW